MTTGPEQQRSAELKKLVSNRKRRRLWPWVAMVLILGGGAAAWSAITWSGQPGNAPRYSTEPIIRGDLLITVTATGTVEPTTEVTISSELSGTIATVEVDYNDMVEVGQPLATLDAVKRQAQVTNSRASLLAAQGQLEQARATATEAKAIYLQQKAIDERGIGSARDLITYLAAHQRAEAELTIADADLQLAQANLDSDLDDLDKMVLRSPIKGVVLDRAAEPGQIVASSLNAPTLFTLAGDLSRMQLLVDIDEADIGKVAVGNSATFSVDAFPGRVFPAKITQVRFAPVTTNSVVTYKAQLSVDNADLALRPGMTATAVIRVTEVKDALLIPNAALRFAPPRPNDGGLGAQTANRGLAGLVVPPRRPPGQGTAQPMATRGRVYVLRDGQPVAVRAQTSESDGLVTILTGGDLAEGERVITGRFSDQPGGTQSMSGPGSALGPPRGAGASPPAPPPAAGEDPGPRP
jgi:HlyD family secretion protein